MFYNFPEFLFGLGVFGLVAAVLLALPITLLVVALKLSHAQRESAELLLAMLRSMEGKLDETRTLTQRFVERLAPAEARGEIPGEALLPAPAASVPEIAVAEVVPTVVEAAPSAASPYGEARAVPPVVIRPLTQAEATQPVETFAEVEEVEEVEETQGAAPFPAAAFTPVGAPPAPGNRRDFEVAAKEILLRIWNWIIVGEEHRPAGVSMEFAVASTWLLRIGIVILVMGVGFFLVYSIERGLIPPEGRVALSILAGVAMLGTGLRLLGGKYDVFARDSWGVASQHSISASMRPTTPII